MQQLLVLRTTLTAATYINYHQISVRNPVTLYSKANQSHNIGQLGVQSTLVLIIAVSLSFALCILELLNYRQWMYGTIW